MLLAEEDPDEPEGFEFVEECPDVRCKKAMVGSKVTAYVPMGLWMGSRHYEAEAHL